MNELTIRLGKIQDLFYKFDEVQMKIEQTDSDFDKQMEEREITENKFYSLIAQAQELIETWRETQKLGKESIPDCGTCPTLTNIKLPPIKLPPFDGNPNRWLEFRDTYLSLIHNNNKIDDIAKFQYLKSFLEEPASAVIRSVSVSASNYKIAWSLLCERYDNKRLLINQHLKDLFAIEPLLRESEKGLRHLVDTISRNLRSLNSLGEPTDAWDTIIIFMASSKLDTATAGRWEEFRSNKESPTLEDFFTFLRHRAEVLETIQSGRSERKEMRPSFVRTKSFIAASSEASAAGAITSSRCLACKQDHKLYDCYKFKSLPVDERNMKVFQWKLCANCLRSGHQSFQCRLGGCRFCKRKHNTLLHKEHALPVQSPPTQQQSTQQNSLQQQEKHTSLLATNNQASTDSELNAFLKSVTDSDLSFSDAETPGPSKSVTMSAVSSSQALLSTALVEVTNNDKKYVLRALLDSGSQTSFISENAQKRIGYHKNKNHIQCVSGLNNTTTTITQHCDIHIKSLHGQFDIPVKCYILPQITDKLPHAEIPIHELNIPKHLNLADPKFYEPADIDLLLGADIFWEIIGSNKFKMGPHQPILQETQLGWIIAGPVGESFHNKSNKVHCHFSREIKDQLSKFWELEELPSHKQKQIENHYCEKLFTETTFRDSDGRFHVQIPLKESPDVLGDSYNIAEKRLLQIERKLMKQPELRQEYNKFIDEYERLGHLSEIPKPVFGCYLPHHAVVRESSETTKVRVVFDASAKTSSGKSFNDIQHVGPVVQDDIFSILLRYRQHKYVITADVEKMYRQIMVTPDQRNLQLILFRNDATEPIKIYQLNTVTYGTASAPFLSTRCLLQLSKDCPDAGIARIIKEDFYVDDFISGAETETELNFIINYVTETLNAACLPLRKFRTNAPSLKNDPTSVIPKDLDLSSQSSALGLKWHPSSDNLQFSVEIPIPSKITKRTILSNSAKLFDPLGLLSLCTITPKIILQKLWLGKLEWDDSVPPEIEKMWLDFVSNLNTLSSFRVPRHVICSEPIAIELHSFSDASEQAYAACVYIRSINASNIVSVRLLCAKSKVAPVKSTTIPRLELCGALLAARMSAKVMKALRCEINKVCHWTDSTVVLSWLSGQSRDLKTFVSNRVGEIQELTSSGVWRHVPGSMNPADLASRGISPNHIQNTSLWWHGPSFLLKNQSNWPENIQSSSDVPERKSYKLCATSKIVPKEKTYNLCTTTTTNTKNQSNTDTNTNLNTYLGEVVSFERFSKFTILQRTMAYVLRFVHNIKHSNSKKTGILTTEELESSLQVLIKQHQTECFSNEIKILPKDKHLPSKSHVLSLSPFLDDNGLLRVGGRIQKASVSYERKHPVLLESNHVFTKLLFRYEHNKLLHCGPQLLLNSIRDRFWPLRGRILARNTVNKCTICRIMKANTVNPIMGNLPEPRVTPNFPFQVSGVDFAGPFYITDRKGRGCKITKCYLCLFVCFSTKALHLEVASDLTTDVFIMCLKRFVSRRGKPSELWCDNGLNFVGANNEISNFLKSSNEDVSSYAASESIKFTFSPAYSPHFGGLWEAGIKSAKFHLVRILGNRHLTFEELSTLFSQIEAILNSRPLTPLSSDPNDYEPLTPGHFLIGRMLTSLPSPSLLDANTNRLDRYQVVEQARQHFWERWRIEFLSELQQRSKWRLQKDGLQVGDLVILKDKNVPPLQWRMGRIEKLYPGPDGVARVADVKTCRGVLRRAVNKLCLLLSSKTPSFSSGGQDV